jgi:prepilin-type N-terminal cleavage/methylation domain-containing protein
MAEGGLRKTMNNEQKNRGFSLAEVLLAIGALAVGMVFVAGVFPVSVYLTTVVSEQTIAAVTADEAFAKVKIYNFAGDVNLGGLVTNQLKNFSGVLTSSIDPCEFAYPSTNVPIGQKQYYWTALCRGVDTNSPRLVQITVFVSRKAGPGLKYPKDSLDVPYYDWPTPVKVSVSLGGNNNELRITTGDKRFINDGYTIADDQTGRIYRVLQRYAPPDDDKILLDRDWDDSSPGGVPQAVWVVPPPVGGGRWPCVGVYQEVIRF